MNSRIDVNLTLAALAAGLGLMAAGGPALAAMRDDGPQAASTQPQADPTVEAADAAFDAGDRVRALDLYERVLARDPGNVHALLRSGMLLSWDRKFASAAGRYDRLLAIDPGNRRAALERAKVLSWDGKYGLAADGFRQLVAKDPGDKDARLGLARALSWAGQQTAAREEYDHLLAREPDSVEALVGKAQTYAWTGDLVNAREWYERSLDVEPGRREAVLGLGYLDLWSGDPAGAERRTADLEKRFPGDREVAALRAETRKARAPWVRTAYDHLDDTDDNELETYRAEAGWGFPKALDLTAGFARYDMTAKNRRVDVGGGRFDNRDLVAKIDSLYAILGMRPRAGQRFTLRAGVDRSEGTTGETDSELIGGVAYSWGAGGLWQWRASADRDTLRYSAEIVDSRVVRDAYALSVSGRFAERWFTDVEASFWDFSARDRDGTSGDNSRDGLVARVRYRWPVRAFTLESGYAFRYMDYAHDRANGYFDPDGFSSHLVELHAAGNFGRNRPYYDASVSAGYQSFDHEGVRTSGDRVFIISGMFGLPLRGGVSLEIHGSRSDYAQQTATGFESRNLGLRLAWRAAGR